MPDDPNIPNEIGPADDDSSSPDTNETDLTPPETDDGSIPADDIEAELRKLQSADDESVELAAADVLQAAAGGQSPDDVEAAMQALLEAEEQVQQAMPSAPAPVAPPVNTTPSASKITPAATPIPLPDLTPSQDRAEFGGLSLLDDVELDLKIELGRTSMYIEDVLHLGVGSVVELDKLAGDPVDVYINERLVARGEVLVLNNNFCVRVNEIISPVPELEVEG